MGYLIDIGAVILVIAILSLAASSVPSKRALIITIGCFAAVIGGSYGISARPICSASRNSETWRR